MTWNPRSRCRCDLIDNPPCRACENEGENRKDRREDRYSEREIGDRADAQAAREWAARGGVA